MRSFLIALWLLMLTGAVDARNPHGGLGTIVVTGIWVNVTPSGVDLVNGDCGNFGTQTARVDKSNPGTFYTEFMCQGIWKSTDYGVTWAGPINTGTNGAIVGDCAGGVEISPNATMGGTPTLYESCIRGGAVHGSSTSGDATGFWKSTDGGVNWTNYNVTPLDPTRQDVYPPQVDPYDSSHLLMAAHEQSILVQSFDGGQTWANVNLDTSMVAAPGSADTDVIFFVNTGSSTTTRTTWLWMGTGGAVFGTWRTTNSGTSWTNVDEGGHSHGGGQIWQPDNSGIIYDAVQYTANGGFPNFGVQRSLDYGVTWTFLCCGGDQTVVWGTTTTIYSMQAFPNTSPAYQTAAYPGTGTWAHPVATPTTGPPAGGGMTAGAIQEAQAFNGAHNIFITANWESGIWRYVEP